MKPDAMPGWQKDEPMTPTNDAEKILARYESELNPKDYETIRTALAKSAKVDGLLDAAMQCLDDAGYIDVDGNIYVAPKRQAGGGICHQAALNLIKEIQRFNGEV